MSSPGSDRAYSRTSSASPGSSRSSTEQQSSLLSLPFPLRQQIWRSVLWDGPSNLHLLRTCQQIHRETAPILLEQPLVFRSQVELFFWLEQVQDRNLDGVKSLTLYVQDLEILSMEDDLTWANASLMELYQLEAEKILSMLKSLSGIKELSVYHVESVQSYLYETFFHIILKKIGPQFSALRKFSYHSDGHPVDFLKSFTNLRELRFTGYSKSTPMETLGVLSRLRHLRGVELIPPVIPKVNGGLDIDSGLPSTLSMTRDVAKGMPRLQTLTIREVNDYLMSPAFLTARFIQSIDSRHRMSLQRFEVNVKFTPDATCQRAIQVLLQSSSMRHVGLVWPKLDDWMLRSVPRTTETLRLPPFAKKPVYWVWTELGARRSELPNLHTLFFVCDYESGRSSSQATLAPAFRAPMEVLSRLGVQTILEYERVFEH